MPPQQKKTNLGIVDSIVILFGCGLLVGALFGGGSAGQVAIWIIFPIAMVLYLVSRATKTKSTHEIKKEQRGKR